MVHQHSREQIRTCHNARRRRGMQFKSKTVVPTQPTYTGSNEQFHRLWQHKRYLKTFKGVATAPSDDKERIRTSIGVVWPSSMEDGRSAWQGRYQQLPQNEPLLPQPLGRRDISQQDGRDSSANQRGERRSRSAQQSRPGAMQPRNMKLPAMLPSTKPVQLRQKDKLVLLPRCAVQTPTFFCPEAQQQFLLSSSGGQCKQTRVLLAVTGSL